MPDPTQNRGQGAQAPAIPHGGALQVASALCNAGEGEAVAWCNAECLAALLAGKAAPAAGPSSSPAPTEKLVEALEKIANGTGVALEVDGEEDWMVFAAGLQGLARAALSSFKTGGDDGERELRSLEWQETLEARGDGLYEVSGWEAATPFDTFYVIEVGAALIHVRHDYRDIGTYESPDEAMAAAQKDFAARIDKATNAPAPSNSRPVSQEEGDQDRRSEGRLAIGTPVIHQPTGCSGTITDYVEGWYEVECLDRSKVIVRPSNLKAANAAGSSAQAEGDGQ